MILSLILFVALQSEDAQAGTGKIPVPLESASVARCPDDPDDLSIRAVSAALTAIPGADTPEIRSARRAYLVHNISILFDPDHLGYLDFTRYSDFQWADHIVVAPVGTCNEDFDQYLLDHFGPQERLKVWEQNPYFLKEQQSQFRFMGGGRGYISRKDYERRYYRPSFGQYDRHHNGKIPVNFMS